MGDDLVYSRVDPDGDTLTLLKLTDGRLQVDVTSGDRLNSVALDRPSVLNLYDMIGDWLGADQGVDQPAGLEALSKIERLQAARVELTRERDDLQTRLNGADHALKQAWKGNEERQAEIEKLGTELGDKRIEIDGLNTLVGELHAKIYELTDERNEAEHLAVGYTAEQQQRASALLMARDAAVTVANKGGAVGAFAGKGEQVRQPDVLSLAHFIVTGQLDYVTAEGEYVERDVDNRPTITNEEIRKANRAVMLDDFCQWLVENVSKDAQIETQEGKILQRGYLIDKLREEFGHASE